MEIPVKCSNILPCLVSFIAAMKIIIIIIIIIILIIIITIILLLLLLLLNITNCLIFILKL